MIKHKSKNFNLKILKKTQVTSSSGFLLILKFEEKIGLFKEAKEKFSFLKKSAGGYSVSPLMWNLRVTRENPVLFCT